MCVSKYLPFKKFDCCIAALALLHSIIFVTVIILLLLFVLVLGLSGHGHSKNILTYI
jgi:hypothetical protein